MPSGRHLRLGGWDHLEATAEGAVAVEARRPPTDEAIAGGVRGERSDRQVEHADGRRGN